MKTRSFLTGLTATRLQRTALSTLAAISLFLVGSLSFPAIASAYPIYAQQAYPSPREATGRIVCANCHLGSKPTEAEVPQAVLPDTVFEAVVKIPYDKTVQQVYADGSKGPINVGAVVVLPPGFKLAPDDRIPEEMKEKVGDVYFQTYSPEQENIIVVGPLPGEQYSELVFPVLSPDPAKDKNVHFGKFSIHVGGNRGRGQVYPTGEKSNNTVYNASVAGKITQIAKNEETDGYNITIQAANGNTTVDAVPPGPELLVSEGDEVAAGQALTSNPNVGGFGQIDKEIVLQSPDRVKWLIAFLAIVTLSQIMLVLKKKQVEKVQAAEMNF